MLFSGLFLPFVMENRNCAGEDASVPDLVGMITTGRSNLAFPMLKILLLCLVGSC